MDELGIIGWIDIVARHINDRRGAFAQAFRRRHGAALVPKKKHDRADEKREADEHSNKRPADPAKDGLTGYFSD